MNETSRVSKVTATPSEGLGFFTRAQSPRAHASICCAAGVLLPALASAVAPPAAYDEALGLATINGEITGDAIFQTCITGANGNGATNNQAFQDDCNLIVGGSFADPHQSAFALDELAAEQINAQNSAASRAAGLGVAVVQNRLERIRLAGTPAGSTSTLIAGSDFLGSQTGGAASGDASFGPFGGFFNFNYASGNEDENAYQPGYDFDRWAFLGGVDYRVNDNLVGGLSLRYANGDADFDNSRGDMSGDSWGVIGYGTYYLPNGLFFDGTLGYASNDYTLKRNINYSIDGVVASQTAKSDPDADVWNFNVGTGYTFHQEAWSFTPALRLNYIQNEVDGYRERMSSPTTPGGSMALSIGSQTYDSFTSDLSIQIAKAISHKSGVILPQLRLGWIHEFKNDQAQVGATFINDINQQPLFILTNEPDRDYFELGVGVAAQFANGRSGFISYNTLLDYKGVTYNSINAGVRLEF